ncbi:hypothetical protein GUJ93_ZPchr0002g23248 [Zizania palustris]|uniref:Uncharacterized protein n=1 Tax=Zizania palustris TaxID=103762 RepID=A0A8J5RWB6_ZIZPA|nr:hypothetical protein GUJ93_ZPchr0002g23248 [Zizania palustris]
MVHGGLQTARALGPWWTKCTTCPRTTLWTRPTRPSDRHPTDGRASGTRGRHGGQGGFFHDAGETTVIYHSDDGHWDSDATTKMERGGSGLHGHTGEGNDEGAAVTDKGGGRWLATMSGGRTQEQGGGGRGVLRRNPVSAGGDTENPLRIWWRGLKRGWTVGRGLLECTREGSGFAGVSVAAGRGEGKGGTDEGVLGLTGGPRVEARWRARWRVGLGGSERGGADRRAPLARERGRAVGRLGPSWGKTEVAAH